MSCGELQTSDEPTGRERGGAIVGRLEGETVGRRRAADVVALGQVAPEVAEQVQRLDVLDALGDHAKSHVVTEVDRRANQLEVTPLAVGAERGDEVAVELELSHGE